MEYCENGDLRRGPPSGDDNEKRNGFKLKTLTGSEHKQREVREVKTYCILRED